MYETPQDYGYFKAQQNHIRKKSQPSNDNSASWFVSSILCNVTVNDPTLRQGWFLVRSEVILRMIKKESPRLGLLLNENRDENDREWAHYIIEYQTVSFITISLFTV